MSNSIGARFHFVPLLHHSQSQASRQRATGQDILFADSIVDAVGPSQLSQVTNRPTSNFPLGSIERHSCCCIKGDNFNIRYNHIPPSPRTFEVPTCTCRVNPNRPRPTIRTSTKLYCSDLSNTLPARHNICLCLPPDLLLSDIS